MGVQLNVVIVIYPHPDCKVFVPLHPFLRPESRSYGAKMGAVSGPKGPFDPSLCHLGWGDRQGSGGFGDGRTPSLPPGSKSIVEIKTASGRGRFSTCPQRNTTEQNHLYAPYYNSVILSERQRVEESSHRHTAKYHDCAKIPPRASLGRNDITVFCCIKVTASCSDGLREG